MSLLPKTNEMNRNPGRKQRFIVERVPHFVMKCYTKITILREVSGDGVTREIFKTKVTCKGATRTDVRVMQAMRMGVSKSFNSFGESTNS